METQLLFLETAAHAGANLRSTVRHLPPIESGGKKNVRMAADNRRDNSHAAYRNRSLIQMPFFWRSVSIPEPMAISHNESEVPSRSHALRRIRPRPSASTSSNSVAFRNCHSSAYRPSEDTLPGKKETLFMHEVLVKVQEAFKSAFGIDPQMVTINTKPGDIPAWDSMGHMELAVNLEKVFGLSFDVDDMMEMEDVKKIVAVVQRKLN
jgi:acyl carrier protein